jgi:hypothetical protein
MKPRALLLSIVLGTALFASYPGLTQVQKVYILPMSSGLDQHLAKSLTRHHQFQVVTDPKAADTIFTDKVGEAFEKKLLELYPPPPPPEEVAKKEKAEKTEKAKSADKERTDVITLKSEPVVRLGGFGRNKGNVFLVDRATKSVIWSFYKLPKNTTPDEMHKTAEAIVTQLQRDIASKDKQ